MTSISFSIHGYLVGNTWMPATECYKPLNYDFAPQEKLWSEPGTLRDHVLAATDDGDFCGAKIANGVLVARVKRYVGSTIITRTRYFALDKFLSIADMINNDWEGPNGDGDGDGE